MVRAAFGIGARRHHADALAFEHRERHRAEVEHDVVRVVLAADLGDAHVADDGHEVGVAVPPRHHVNVQVVGNAGPGHAALVQPDVEALGAVLRGERRDRPLGQAHRVGELVRPDLDEAPDVAVQDGHDVAGRVREGVEDQEREAAPLQDERPAVVTGGQRRAEHAHGLGAAGGRHVRHPPGRPEPLHSTRC